MAWWNSRRSPAWGVDGDIETRALPQSTLANPQGWLVDSLGGPRSPSGQRVTVGRALGLSPVWAAVTLISEQVGMLPLKVYRYIEDTGERVEARSHRMWSILHTKPNSHTPADRFWSAVTAQLLLYGNAFIEKRRDPVSGIVDELFLLDPERVTVEYDPRTADKQFLYRPALMGLGPRRYSTDEVLHVFGFSLDGIVGLSVIQENRASLGAALARDEFEGNFYGRGANLSGVLKHPNRLNRDAVDNLRASFAALYGGSGNAHKVPVLEEGMEFVTIGSPLRDLEFVASQNMSRTDIAVMFKLPPNRLGGSSGDSLTYATVESNSIDLAMYAFAPPAHTIAKALSSDPGVLPQNVFEAEFELKALMRADATTRAGFYKTMHDIGAMTDDEIRSAENLPALTDAQREQMKPPAPTPPVLAAGTQLRQLPLPVPGGGSNGNGNGAMPATIRS